MGLQPGDLIPRAPECEQLDPIYFSMMRKDGDAKLRQQYGSNVTGRAPIAAKKNEWIQNFFMLGLNVCEADEFCQQSHMLRVKLNRSFCPWFGNAGVKYKVFGSMSEGDSPFNFGTAQVGPIEGILPANQSASGTLSVGPTTPCFEQYGGCVPWSCSYLLEVPVHQPSLEPMGFIKLTSTLTSGGYDRLSGMEVTQIATLACDLWVNGGGLQIFWTGIGPYIGPIGLVRSLSITVRGTREYV